jgi:hypothetical protein
VVLGHYHEQIEPLVQDFPGHHRPQRSTGCRPGLLLCGWGLRH